MLRRKPSDTEAVLSSFSLEPLDNAIVSATALGSRQNAAVPGVT